jgi:hypothetical protein
MLNDFMDGHGYIGSPNGRESYVRVKDSIELSDLYNNPKMMRLGRPFIYALTGSDGFIEVHGNDAQTQLKVTAVFTRPVHVPDFDIDEDIYPVSSFFPRMKELAAKITLNYMAMTPEDRFSDFQNQLNQMRTQFKR